VKMTVTGAYNPVTRLLVESQLTRTQEHPVFTASAQLLFQMLGLLIVQTLVRASASPGDKAAVEGEHKAINVRKAYKRTIQTKNRPKSTGLETSID
jgi:hypothetical protein